jgi:hypothetical protein
MTSTDSTGGVFGAGFVVPSRDRPGNTAAVPADMVTRDYVNTFGVRTLCRPKVALAFSAFKLDDHLRFPVNVVP